ncbi:DUF2971 domain-containing protein [Chitinophaga caeni]|nr:DUF2971 domain-containing protein [Chitinophaga caeni]
MNEYIIDEEYVYRLNDEKNNIWDIYKNGNKNPKSCKQLYKYYSLNLYSIDALLRNYFYLANPSSFNDPFDCNINLIKDVQNISKYTSVKRNNVRNIGICCLSETLDNHLMWAHYTNNYNGFCLGFRGDNIDANANREIFPRHSFTKVIYPASPVSIEQQLPFAQNYLFTTKFKHWEYEQEWRLIAEITNEREMIFYPESVEAIYIGHSIVDTNPSAYKLLLEIQEIKFPQIPVYVVYPAPFELKLKFEKVWN